MRGRRRSARWVTKWFTGRWFWVGYSAIFVVVVAAEGILGPRWSLAINIGIEATFLALIVAGLLISKPTYAAARAHHAAGELAYDRARAEHREVRALYEKIYAELDEGAGK